MALENVPVEARGLLSGVFQQGYSFGYVIAACANLGVGGATNSWPIMFYIGAAGSFAVGIARIFFPESRQFLEAKKNGAKGAHTGAFIKEAGVVLKQEWKRVVYTVTLMAGFNVGLLASRAQHHAHPTSRSSSRTQRRTPTPPS